jgi:hypothetical protein
MEEFESDKVTIIQPSPALDPKDDVRTLIKDLEDIRKALWSYRKLLTGEKCSIPLKEIRALIVFPTPGEENPARPYLAVHECELHHPFPNNEVVALGLVDLPGLGALIKDVDRHHLEGVQNDIDLVVMLKRAIEHPGMAPL